MTSYPVARRGSPCQGRTTVTIPNTVHDRNESKLRQFTRGDPSQTPGALPKPGLGAAVFTLFIHQPSPNHGVTDNKLQKLVGGIIFVADYKSHLDIVLFASTWPVHGNLCERESSCLSQGTVVRCIYGFCILPIHLEMQFLLRVI